MKRLIILIAIGFVIGKLAVSALQSLSHTPSARTGNFNFEKGLDDYKRLPPIPDADPKMPPLDPAAFAYKSGAKVTPQVSGFNAGGVQVAKTEPVKKVEDKKKDDKKDDKKKDQDSDDQKRKKKLEDDAQNQTPNVPVPQALPPPGAPRQQNPGYGGPIVAPPPQTETPPTPPPYYGGGAANATPVNIVGYIDALVHRPTSALMQAFVGLWQKKQITAAQYYEVLDAMQKSSVLLSRQYAIQAAAMQQSYQDFQILADETLTEPDPTTKAQASNDVQAYAVPSDVAILNEGLASTDASAKLEAADLLAPIISGYFKSKNTQAAESLQILIPTLGLLAQAPGPLQTQAQTMLQELTQLLGVQMPA